MSLEIHGISTGSISPEFGKSDGIRIPVIQQRSSLPVKNDDTEADGRTPEQIVKELADLPEVRQRKLKFSIDRELDIVVVKVIDAQTDKLIKELPPEELQDLHARLRKALGLLIDETV